MIKKPVLLTVLVLTLFSQTSPPKSTSSSKIITYAVSAWSWSRQTRGYYKLAGVRKVREEHNARGRISKRIIHTKGALLFSTEEFSYENDKLTKIGVRNGRGEIMYNKTYQRNTAGTAEIIRDSNGNLVRHALLIHDKNNQLLTKQEYTPERKLIQVSRYFYDDKGRLGVRLVSTPAGTPLHHSQYRYERDDNKGRWLVRNERQMYADVGGSPKEIITRNLAGYSGKVDTAGVSRPADYPRFTLGTYYKLNEKLAAGSEPGSRVLATALGHIKAKTIIKGSCYDWINMVYKQCGYSGKTRAQYFLRKKGAPYLNPLELKPGDWIMFKNQSYGDKSHSGIFMHWIDFDSRSALVIGYVGQNRSMPGRYREYDITRTFGVIRGKKTP